MVKVNYKELIKKLTINLFNKIEEDSCRILDDLIDLNMKFKFSIRNLLKTVNLDEDNFLRSINSLVSLLSIEDRFSNMDFYLNKLSKVLDINYTKSLKVKIERLYKRRYQEVKSKGEMKNWLFKLSSKSSNDEFNEVVSSIKSILENFKVDDLKAEKYSVMEILSKNLDLDSLKTIPSLSNLSYVFPGLLENYFREDSELDKEMRERINLYKKLRKIIKNEFTEKEIILMGKEIIEFVNSDNSTLSSYIKFY